MSGCECETHATELAGDIHRRQTLRVVFAINAIMFVVVLMVGLWADSQALIADSADNLGDALVYALSLFVISRSVRWLAGAALVKALVQLAFGVLVVVSIVNSLSGTPNPIGLTIMLMAAVALLANLICFYRLLEHRDEDINMRSVWLCSRNDVLANAGVIMAGALVLLLDSYWPDHIVAAVIAVIFLQTSYVVFRDALRAWNTPVGSVPASSSEQ